MGVGGGGGEREREGGREGGRDGGKEGRREERGRCEPVGGRCRVQFLQPGRTFQTAGRGWIIAERGAGGRKEEGEGCKVISLCV